jgi:VanZ family protein
VYAHGIPAMAWAAFLMVTALAPSLGPIEDIDIITHQDKLVHFVQYLILSFLTFFALVRGTRRDRAWQMRVTVASVIAYGALLEVLQLAVPDRSPSLMDVVANAAGTLVGAWVAQATLEPLALRKG